MKIPFYLRCFYGKTRTVRRFCFLPVRCPQSGRWFWFEFVYLHQNSTVAYRALSWGLGVIPYQAWNTVFVA